VELKLKTPWRDGSTHLVMSLMEFIQRLAALVLQPRLHLPMTASWPSISAIGCPVWVGSASSLGAGAVTGLRRRRTAMKVRFLRAADSRIARTSTSGLGSS
jgi:hypothetical protein